MAKKSPMDALSSAFGVEKKNVEPQEASVQETDGDNEHVMNDMSNGQSQEDDSEEEQEEEPTSPSPAPIEITAKPKGKPGRPRKNPLPISSVNMPQAPKSPETKPSAPVAQPVAKVPSKAAVSTADPNEILGTVRGYPLLPVHFWSVIPVANDDHVLLVGFSIENLPLVKLQLSKRASLQLMDSLPKIVSA